MFVAESTLDDWTGLAEYVGKNDIVQRSDLRVDSCWYRRDVKENRLKATL